MYSILDYGKMIADRRRTDAYRDALRARITPSSVVLDIGAGPGILTLLACQAGARKVYAIEPDPMIQVAREAVAANGYADRVEFIQGFSTEVNLSERVDVIVSDLHGILPFYEGGIASLIDARDRFLQPGGAMIPCRETVWLGLVSTAAEYHRIVDPWDDSYGLDGRAGRQRAVNSYKNWHGQPTELVEEPRPIIDLDYLTVTDVNASGQTSWSITKRAEAHGIAVWFDSEFAPGIGYSNAPPCEEHWIYKQLLFPLAQPCSLSPGDQVSVGFRADAINRDYAFTWKTVVVSPDDPNPIKANFQQSSLLGSPTSSAWLTRTSPKFVPSPSLEGKIDRAILGLLFTGNTLEDISRQLSEEFPQQFANAGAALNRVAAMSARYSG